MTNDPAAALALWKLLEKCRKTGLSVTLDSDGKDSWGGISKGGTFLFFEGPKDRPLYDTARQLIMGGIAKGIF